MQAVVLNAQRQFVDQERPTPVLRPFDILVSIQAIAVNPIDLKRVERIGPTDSPIFGYDALGTITALGPQASRFKVGDRVFYAGSTQRDGAYAEQQAVDERLVALAPKNVSAADAVAMPLTWLTAAEILQDKLGLSLERPLDHPQSLLIINGAGGAGSILTQLAHQLGVTVLATSSPQHFEWLRQHGVDIPLDYHQPLVPQVRATKLTIDASVNLFDTGRYFEDLVTLVRPFGHLVNVTRTSLPVDVQKLQAKSQSFDWELMFTKSALMYHLQEQGVALAQLQRWLDDGRLKSTRTQTIQGPLNAATILQAHRQLAQHQTVGKLVIERTDSDK